MTSASAICLVQLSHLASRESLNMLVSPLQNVYLEKMIVAVWLQSLLTMVKR